MQDTINLELSRAEADILIERLPFGFERIVERLRQSLDSTKANCTKRQLDALALVDYWRNTVPGRAGARTTPGRVAKVAARLRDGYTVEQIKAAIAALAASAWHNGENDRGQAYNDITFLCRSGEVLERFTIQPKQEARGRFAEALKG